MPFHRSLKPFRFAWCLQYGFVTILVTWVMILMFISENEHQHHNCINTLQNLTRITQASSEGKDLQINCSNINDIKLWLFRTLGRGVSKQVFLGQYEGQEIAIKMVTPKVQDIYKCQKALSEQKSREGEEPTERELKKCYMFPNMKIMKEILILQSLKHPNLVKLVGYCVRGEDTESLSLKDHGVIAVYEHLKQLDIDKAAIWPIQDRLQALSEVAELLYYLEHSPMGSLLIADMKKNHLMLRGERTIVLNDLDDFNAKDEDCSDGLTTCPFNLACIEGTCLGSNAKHNIEGLYKLLFEPLLQCGNLVDNESSLKMQLKTTIKSICTKLSRNEIRADKLRYMMRSMLVESVRMI